MNIADAYNMAELQGVHPSLVHDTSYDKRTGFKTKQVLTYPIVADNKYLMGVIQLLNKKSGGRFTRKDEESVAEIAKALGIAFFNLRRSSKKNPYQVRSVWSRTTKSLKTNWTMPSPNPEKACRTSKSILIEKYKVPKVEIGKSLAQFHKCPYIEYSERTIVDIELLKNLNVDYLKKNHWMPLKRDRTAIEILTDDPGDLDRVADIKRTFPGLNIRFAVSLRRDIAQFLLRYGHRAGDTGSTES